MSGNLKHLVPSKDPKKNFLSAINPTSDSTMTAANPGSWIGIPDPVHDYLHPKKPIDPALPGAPTIDQAAQRQQESDRILRRRGVLANIFGGLSGGTPSVGKATLGGS